MSKELHMFLQWSYKILQENISQIYGKFWNTTNATTAVLVSNGCCNKIAQTTDLKHLFSQFGSLEV